MEEGQQSDPRGFDARKEAGSVVMSPLLSLSLGNNSFSFKFSIMRNEKFIWMFQIMEAYHANSWVPPYLLNQNL